MVVTQARRMLSINEIARSAAASRRRRPCASPSPAISPALKIPATLAQFQSAGPTSASRERNQLRKHAARAAQGDIDLAVAIAHSQPSIEAHHLWVDQAVWVRSDATQLDPVGPVPLVSFGEDCSCRYTAVNALNRVGRECDFVFTSRSIASLEAAVLAGLGIMVLPRCRSADRALDLGGRAAARAAAALLGSTCGRAATARRSRSSPTRSRPCCVRRSSSGRAEPRPSSCRRARADRVIGTLVTAPGIASGAAFAAGRRGEPLDGISRSPRSSGRLGAASIARAIRTLAAVS